MSSFKKGNPELEDRDRAARHRNLKCDIALRKQISQMQREGQILEREMREIRKVKETLKQLRKPIKHSSHEDKKFTENRYEKEELKAAVNLIGGHGIVQALPQGSEQQKQRKPKKGTKESPNKTAKTVRFDSKHASSHCDIVTKAKGNQIKENENSTVNELSEINVAQETKTCKIIQVAPCQATNSKELVDETVSSETSDQHPEDIPRPGTSNILSAEATMPAQRPRSCKSFCAGDRQNEITLTMEETLRIKGKFRQIGHSVIAGALLKGLKQRNALTSETIHNLHHTVLIDTPTPNEEKLKTEEIERENAKEEKNPTNRFRKAVRKTIVLNRVFSVASNDNRHRSFSSPAALEAAESCSHEKHRKKSLMNASALRTREWRKHGGAVRTLEVVNSPNRKFEDKIEQNSMKPTDDIQDAMEEMEVKEEQTTFFPEGLTEA